MTEFTGERVVPGQVNDDLWAEHFSRYAFASRMSAGLRVLDLGCGTGYGTAELATEARCATGIDIAPEAVTDARNQFTVANLAFLAASATVLPFRDASFDLITAFEVIEHLTDWQTMLAEARRVLRPRGVFLVSTPNKLYYTESRGKSGPNPFHMHEFEFQEFRAALAQHFPSATVLLQNHLETFAFYPYGESFPVDARLDGTRGGPDDAHFFLGVCSIESAPELHSFLFVPHAANILRERERHIAGLERQVEFQKAEVATAREERDKLIVLHGEQSLHLEKQNLWARKLDQELTAAQARIVQVQDELEDRSAWAVKLDAQVRRLEAHVQKVESTRWMRLGRKLRVGPEPYVAEASENSSAADQTGNDG